MSILQEAKLAIVGLSHLGKDALHIYVGLGVFLGSALVFGWSLKSWRPWLLVLVAALCGEIWDLRDTIVDGATIRFGANLKDVLNTLFWPTVLLVLARTTRVLRR